MTQNKTVQQLIIVHAYLNIGLPLMLTLQLVLLRIHSQLWPAENDKVKTPKFTKHATDENHKQLTAFFHVEHEISGMIVQSVPMIYLSLCM